MSSVACNNQFNLVLDVQDKNPQCFLSDSDQMRRLLVNLVQSAIRYSSEQIVQISVRIQENKSGMKRLELNRSESVWAADSGAENPEPINQTFCSAIPTVKPVSVELKRYEFPPCTILIVDDLGETHLALAQILKPYHFGWIHIYNVDETLDNVQRYFPDLILMDVCFPGSRQTQIVRQVRQWEQTLYQAAKATKQNKGNKSLPAAGNIPIIAFSSYVDSAQDNLLLDSGCSDILHKPLSPEALVTMLAKWLAAWEVQEEDNVIDVLSDSALSLWESQRQVWKTTCERMSKGMSFSEVESFSNEVRQFGEQIHSSVLLQWAERLLFAVKNCDLTKMKKMLLQFCDLSIG